jgi:hypothetical protein
VRCRVASLTLLLAGFFAPAAAEEARVAVERFVARMGEIAVMDLTVAQTLTLYHPQDPRQQVTGHQRLWIKLPARQRVETEIGGDRDVRVLNGDRLVVSRGGRAFEAPPAERARQRAHTLFPFRRTAADLLREWAGLGIRTEVARSVRAGGRVVTLIGAAEGDRTSPAVWVDPEFGVVRIVTRETGPDGPWLLDLAFSEHRKVAGGFFYPFRQESFRAGKLFMLVLVRTVEVNTDPDDALFDADAMLKGSSR